MPNPVIPGSQGKRCDPSAPGCGNPTPPTSLYQPYPPATRHPPSNRELNLGRPNAPTSTNSPRTQRFRCCERGLVWRPCRPPYFRSTQPERTATLYPLPSSLPEQMARAMISSLGCETNLETNFIVLADGPTAPNYMTTPTSFIAGFFFFYQHLTRCWLAYPPKHTTLARVGGKTHGPWLGATSNFYEGTSNN